MTPQHLALAQLLMGQGTPDMQKMGLLEQMGLGGALPAGMGRLGQMGTGGQVAQGIGAGGISPILLKLLQG